MYYWLLVTVLLELLLYLGVFGAAKKRRNLLWRGVFGKQIFGTNVQRETARPNIRLGKKVKWVLFRSHINKVPLFLAAMPVFLTVAV